MKTGAKEKNEKNYRNNREVLLKLIKRKLFMNLSSTPELLRLSIEEILDVLPHRYPMLLVDRLESVLLGERAVGIKNVTMNEPFFTGHFPQKPVMPGVLMIEALAQTAAVLVMRTLGMSHRDHLVYFMSISEARFRKPVYPGDTLQLVVEKKHQRGPVWKFYGAACVNEQIMAEATYTAMITSKNGNDSKIS